MAAAPRDKVLIYPDVGNGNRQAYLCVCLFAIATRHSTLLYALLCASTLRKIGSRESRQTFAFYPLALMSPAHNLCLLGSVN